MAKRSNHYDVAFEELLRMMRRPYVAVDEARRALYRQTSLKSMDFIVYSQHSPNLLIDVKGRQYPTGNRLWENWAMQDDISSLMEWEQVFGDNFRSLLVFVYEILDTAHLTQHSVTWKFRNRWYAFYGVWTQDYAAAMKSRSPNWKTVNLPVKDYEKLRVPMLELL